MCSSDGIAALTAALDTLAAVDLTATPTVALGEQLVALTRLAARLDAQQLRRLERFDRAGGAAATGAASTAAWLRHACRLAPAEAASRTGCARRLTDTLTATAAALAAGEISYRHAAVLSTATTGIPQQATTAAEPTLLTAARQLNPQQLCTVTTHWRHALDADTTRHDEDTAHAQRRLSISTTLGGTVVLDGQLPAEDGALLLTAIHALAAPQPEDPRTPTQRRADALVELARRALDHGHLPDTGGERPHLTITLDLATLQAHPGAPAATADWTGPISAHSARRLACDAGVTRIITDGASEIFDVSRRTRTIRPALHKALTIRDKGCTHPTCDRPPQWCDAHHIHHWADGGPTNLDNLTLLCRHHHRQAHNGHWHIPAPRPQPQRRPAEARMRR